MGKEVDIKKYKDLEGVTLGKLALGLWFIKHRKHFRIIFIVFLILVSAVSWVYSVYGFAYYLTRGIKEDNKMATQLAQTNAITRDFLERLIPKKLQFFPVEVIKSSPGKYDFAVKIKNINDKHWGDLEYYFSAAGEEVGHASSFILPGKSKYLLALAQELETPPVNVELKIKKLSWHRIDSKEIPDWSEFSDNRLKDITVTNIKFSPAHTSGLSENVALNYLEFDVINKTAYNYWDIDFSILLFRGSKIMGVNKYKLNEVISDQEYHASLSWAERLGLIDRVEVVPDINIIRDDIYIKYEGGVGEEK